MQGRVYYVVMDARFFIASSEEKGDDLAFMSVEQLQECKSALEEAKAHIWNDYDNLAPHTQSSGQLSQAPKSQLSVGYTEAQAREKLDEHIKRVDQALASRKDA